VAGYRPSAGTSWVPTLVLTILLAAYPVAETPIRVSSAAGTCGPGHRAVVAREQLRHPLHDPPDVGGDGIADVDAARPARRRLHGAGIGGGRAPARVGPGHGGFRGGRRRYRQSEQDQVFRPPVGLDRVAEQASARVGAREQEQVDQRPDHRPGPQHHLGLIPEQDDLCHDRQRRHHQQRGKRRDDPVPGGEVCSPGRQRARCYGGGDGDNGDGPKPPADYGLALALALVVNPGDGRAGRDAVRGRGGVCCLRRHGLSAPRSSARDPRRAIRPFGDGGPELDTASQHRW
jgi:hypothetical protein